MILRWRGAGESDGELYYEAADAATRRWADERLPGLWRSFTRVEIHDRSRPGETHAYPMPMGCGDEPRPRPSETACNRCNRGRPLGEHPCPRCGCPEYRMLVRIEE